MDEKFKDIIFEIQKHYKNKLKTNKKIFYHLLERIGIKLIKLKESQDESLFRREVADLYLLVLGLIVIKKIGDETIRKSADYYLKKIINIYA